MGTTTRKSLWMKSIEKGRSPPLKTVFWHGKATENVILTITKMSVNSMRAIAALTRVWQTAMKLTLLLLRKTWRLSISPGRLIGLVRSSVVFLTSIAGLDWTPKKGLVTFAILRTLLSRMLTAKLSRTASWTWILTLTTRKCTKMGLSSGTKMSPKTITKTCTS